MTRIAAHGIAVDLPAGWDGQIYVRGGARALPDDPALTDRPAEAYPILHASNVPLPADRGDYGGNAVEAMGSGGIFLALLEEEPASAQTAMYRFPVPWPLAPDDFQPQQMQRGIPGGAGCQRFFVVGDRPFCLYAAIGSHAMRTVLTREVNRVLASVVLDGA